jgi:hypothetical protein
MKNIDIKSILIGVLAGALLFACADTDKTSPSIVSEAKAQEGTAALSGMVGRYQAWPEYAHSGLGPGVGDGGMGAGGAQQVDPNTGLPLGAVAGADGGGGLPDNMPDVELQLFDTATGNYYVIPGKGGDRSWRLIAKLK